MNTMDDSTTNAAGKYPAHESVKARAMDWVAAFWEGKVFAPAQAKAHTTPEPDDMPPPKNDPTPQEVPQPDPPPVQDPMPHQKPRRLN